MRIDYVEFEMRERDGTAHLVLVGRPHDTDGFDCWCHPTFYAICDECNGGCWRCDNGTQERTRDEAAFETARLLVVHF